MRLIAMTLFYGCARPAAADTAPRRLTYDLGIEKRRLAGPTSTIRATRGDTVVLRWTSDEATILHLHGYDLELPLEPGTPASMTFDAYATGRFPISAHGFGARREQQRETTILYLEVHPR